MFVPRQPGFAVGMDDSTFVVNDADNFQFQGCTGWVINASSKVLSSVARGSGSGDMEATKLKPRDVVSYLGRDYVVEGVLTYKINGKALSLAKAVDGDVVLWIEPLTDSLDDRVLILTQVHDIDVGSPPPQSISYRNSAFLPRLSGTATVDIDGKVADRAVGSCELWRYRAAGDLFLQIESRPSGTVTLFGEAIHKGMVDVLPGK